MFELQHIIKQVPPPPFKEVKGHAAVKDIATLSSSVQGLPQALARNNQTPGK